MWAKPVSAIRRTCQTQGARERGQYSRESPRIADTSLTDLPDWATLDTHSVFVGSRVATAIGNRRKYTGIPRASALAQWVVDSGIDDLTARFVQAYNGTGCNEYVTFPSNVINYTAPAPSARVTTSESRAMTCKSPSPSAVSPSGSPARRKGSLIRTSSLCTPIPATSGTSAPLA